MRENRINETNKERIVAGKVDIDKFDKLMQEIRLNGYDKKYGLELSRNKDHFIIKIGQEVIYIPLWHTITVRRGNTKDDIDIIKHIKRILSDHKIEMVNYEK